MLPPQLHRTAVSPRTASLATHALKASSVLHSRAFWSWRRDWTSQLDPVYRGFARTRTLKTRAKLLRSLRRRGKFNWDFDSKPFFTPCLARWASHWDGSGKKRGWYLDSEDAKKEKDGRDAQKASIEEDGFELSRREKEWREKMEAMRKRIEKDPYETIFGKRFEPFWSPLVPSWMREEMGLQGWPKTQKDSTKPAPEDAVTKTVKNETADKPKAKETAPTVKAKPAEEQPVDGQKSVGGQPSSYSYASSTSWDSWTNRTRRVEWDSMSGQTRKYEYDPISNRMVQVEAPKTTATKGIEGSSEPAKAAETPKTDSASNPPDSKAVKIPVQQSAELRKSIPIPPPLSQPSHSIPLGFSKCTVTSVGPLKSVAITSEVPKPSALAKLPEKEKPKEKDVDTLTADDVRASMGKTKTALSHIKMTDEKSQIEAILNERNAARGRMHATKTVPTQWDQAEMGVMLDKELESLQKKKEKLVKDERGLFHIERQRKELLKLDERIKEVTARVEKLSVSAEAPKDKPTGLQPSLDRMQSKDLPKAIELDDSAAHESTEPLQGLNGVPKNWAQQAELLQADRVRRSASKRPYPLPLPGRWAEDMQARKTAHEIQETVSRAESGEAAAAAERQAKLEKANKILEDEVAEQKMKMQAHENRYSHKIRSLRQELEVAYKQSTVHAEKHLERVRFLEQELEKAQKAVGPNFPTRNPTSSPGLEWLKKKEAEKAEQKARDRELVKEVREIYEKAYGVIDAQHQQAPAEKVTETLKIIPKKESKVVEVESDVDLGEALARYEKEALQPKQNLENQIAFKERLFYEGHDAAAEVKAKETSGKKLVDDEMPKLIPTEIARGSAEEAAATSTSATIQWEEPPVYKVLAYDPGNDMMSTATTTSNFSGTEAPISISQALSQLYQPARFVPYFAELQKDGYQVIYGTKDLLVFKKVKGLPAQNLALEDHGLVWVESAREEGDAKDVSAMPTSTGSLVEEDAQRAREQQEDEDLDIEWRHYPRVRRMEQHFTGSRRRWNSNHRRHFKRAEERGHEGRKRHERSTLKWILGVGLGTATVMYVVGAAAEKAREGKEREEDWARKAREMEKRRGF